MYKDYLIIAIATLAIGGCELLGVGQRSTIQPNYEIKNNLVERLRRIQDGNSPFELEEGVQAASVQLIGFVDPPVVNGRSSSASYIYYDQKSKKIFLGYKVVGDIFGGAIDVLKFTGASPLPVRARQAVVSNNVDVQEVTYADGKQAIYLAGAVKTRKDVMSPSIISRLSFENGKLNSINKRMEDNVGKSVTRDGQYIYANTDENSLYRFNLQLKDKKKIEKGDAQGFRSVISYGPHIFVLDQSGIVFRGSRVEFGSLTPWVRVTDVQMKAGAIARIDILGDRLLTSLNERGFALFSPVKKRVWKSYKTQNVKEYHSVVGREMQGFDFIYAARKDGVVSIFKSGKELPQAGEKLNRVDEINVSQLTGQSIVINRINHMKIIGNYMFLAASSGGVLILRISSTLFS